MDSVGHNKHPSIATAYNPRVIKLLEQYESFSNKPYKDIGGIWTQGYGNTIGVTKNSKDVSKDEGEAQLKTRVISINNFINKVVRVPLTDGQRVALISLVDNIGHGAFRSSTLLKLLNHHDYYGAMLEFNSWQYVKGKNIRGLLSRRIKEISIFAGL